MKLDFIPLAVVAVAFLDLAVVLGLGARRLLALARTEKAGGHPGWSRW
ncbi:MAG: hypothetical protein WKF31_10735 [Thermoleophilaceae bacterium]